MSERDTHFQGSASQVADEIFELDDQWIDTRSTYNRDLVAAIIAQYAYDVVKFVLENTSAITLDSAMRHFDSVVVNVPDLTKWPIREKQRNE